MANIVELRAAAFIPEEWLLVTAEVGYPTKG